MKFRIFSSSSARQQPPCETVVDHETLRQQARDYLQNDMVPDGLMDAISQELFTNPVMVVQTRQIYEKSHIERWFRRSNIDPLTGVAVRHQKLVPANAKAAELQAFMQAVQAERLAGHARPAPAASPSDTFSQALPSDAAAPQPRAPSAAPAAPLSGVRARSNNAAASEVPPIPAASGTPEAELVAALRSHAWQRRLGAVRALVASDPGALSELLPLCAGDRDLDVRRAVLDALLAQRSHLSFAAITSILEPELASNLQNRRLDGIQTLLRLRDFPIGPLLEYCVNEGDEAGRRLILHALVSRCSELSDATITNILRAEITANSWQRRLAGVRTLLSVPGFDIAPLLSRYAGDSDEDVRPVVLGALASRRADIDDATITAILKCELESTSPERRFSGVQALLAIPDFDVSPLLASTAGDSDRGIRRVVLDALVSRRPQIADAAITTILRAELTANDWQRRLAGVKTLLNLPGFPMGALLSLSAADRDGDVRQVVQNAFVARAAELDAAVMTRVLTPELDSPYAERRMAGLQTLLAIPNFGISGLLARMAGDGDAGVRQVVLAALIRRRPELSDATITTILRSELTSGHWQRRLAGVRTLLQVPGFKPGPLLFLCADDNDADVRRIVLDALVSRSSDIGSAITAQVLTRQLDAGSVERRLAGVKTLLAIPNFEISALLARLAGDGDAAVVQALLAALVEHRAKLSDADITSVLIPELCSGAWNRRLDAVNTLRAVPGFHPADLLSLCADDRDADVRAAARLGISACQRR